MAVVNRLEGMTSQSAHGTPSVKDAALENISTL